MAQRRQTREDVSAFLFQARKGRKRKAEVNSWIKTRGGGGGGSIRGNLEIAASKISDNTEESKRPGDVSAAAAILSREEAGSHGSGGEGCGRRAQPEPRSRAQPAAPHREGRRQRAADLSAGARRRKSGHVNEGKNSPGAKPARITLRNPTASGNGRESPATAPASGYSARNRPDPAPPRLSPLSSRRAPPPRDQQGPSPARSRESRALFKFGGGHCAPFAEAKREVSREGSAQHLLPSVAGEPGVGLRRNENPSVR